MPFDFPISPFSQTPPPGPGNLEPVILDQSALYAPHAVFLGLGDTSGTSLQVAAPPAGASPNYQPERAQWRVKWTLRNSPLTFERAPYLNLPILWKNANVYWGYECCIVFDGPGTYEIDVEVEDRFGNVESSASPLTIVVASRDAFFTGGQTVSISPSSDFTGATPGSVTYDLNAGSAAGARAAIQALGATNTKVEFMAGVDYRVGDLWPVSTQIPLSQVQNNQALVTSFGSGAKPILPLGKQAANGNAALFDVVRDNGNAKFVNLDLRGGWEADKERGYQGAGPIWRDTNTDVLFHRCRVSGANAVNNQNRSGDCYFIWSDGEITNWQNFALYGFTNQGGLKRFATIGSDLHQHELALGGFDKSGAHNEHGPMRLEHNDNVYLHVVDFFTKNGWSPGAGRTADQPCIRVNATGLADAHTIADRCGLEGGYQVIKARGQDAGAATPDVAGNHWFGKILTIGTMETQWHLDATYGGMHFEDVIAIEFNVPKLSLGIEDGMFNFDSDDNINADNVQTPVSIISSTFVSLLSTANQRASNASAQANVPGVTHSGDFVDYTQDNIVTYMPNQDAPDTTTPVDIVTGMAGGRFGFNFVTPRFPGRRESIPRIEVNGNGTNTLSISYSQILDRDGNPTSQAYWLARNPEGGFKHFVLAEGYTFLHSELGELTVAFNASDVTIQRLDGQVFSNGINVVVKLDQSDNLPVLDTTYDLRGFTVPTCKLENPVALEANSVSAIDDFDGLPRNGTGVTGAPVGTDIQGAYRGTA